MKRHREQRGFYRHNCVQHKFNSRSKIVWLDNTALVLSKGERVLGGFFLVWSGLVWPGGWDGREKERKRERTLMECDFAEDVRLARMPRR